MAEILKDISYHSPEECISYANKLIEACELPFPRISSIQDINSNFFVALFECITGLTVPDLLVSNDSTTDVHNIQAVIDTLSLDLLGMSLSHITGEDVASGNGISIFNLLEILEGVFLHFSSKKEKERPDTSSSDGNFKRASSEKKIIKRSSSSTESTVSTESAVSSESAVSTESAENVPPARVLKRKTCRNTLRKSQQVPDKKIAKASGESSSKRYSDTVDNARSPMKRKLAKPISRTIKRPHTEDIEKLYGSNFEKKLRILLQGSESPVLHAQRLKKKYIQSLNTPLKKKSIPPCKKSFLLPHNLRCKTKSPVRQTEHKKKTSCRSKSVKKSSSENIIENNEKDGNIPPVIQSVLEEFPGFKFPKSTLQLLEKQYYHHVNLMHKQLKNSLMKKPSTFIETEKAIKDEAKLSEILAKDLQERKHLRGVHERKALENKIKFSFRDARLRSAKTRQYFEEFQKSMSRKLQKRNFSEEILVEKTFEEILDLQKEKVRLLCKKVKETNEQDAKQQRQYLYALKNLYQEQLALLAESVNAEQRDKCVREKSQKLAAEKQNQELRKKLQRDVRSIQKDVLELIEDIHFRELDAQNFIRTFQQ